MRVPRRRLGYYVWYPIEGAYKMEDYRRESRLAIERSRARREQSPHSWPTLLGWVGALLATVVIMLVCYGFVVFFGVGTWS